MLVSHELCSGDSKKIIVASVVGGVDCIQLREKNLNSRQLFEAGQELRKLCTELNIKFIVNDNVEVALALKADGVHLGQDDMHPEDARSLVGNSMWIGWSTHDLEQLDEAAEYGADYAGFGPVFASETKGYARGLGPEHLAAGLAISRVPVIAIGGINPDNCWMIPEQCGIAVSSALADAENPELVAKSLRNRSLESN